MTPSPTPQTHHPLPQNQTSTWCISPASQLLQICSSQASYIQIRSKAVKFQSVKAMSYTRVKIYIFIRLMAKVQQLVYKLVYKCRSGVHSRHRNKLFFIKKQPSNDELEEYHILSPQILALLLVLKVPNRTPLIFLVNYTAAYILRSVFIWPLSEQYFVKFKQTLVVNQLVWCFLGWSKTIQHQVYTSFMSGEIYRSLRV